MMPGVPPPLPFQDEITTIFVVGFPDDMNEREFQNMFTFCPGFEAAALKIPTESEDTQPAKKQIIGFAKFRSIEEAIRARDILSGRKVDSEKGCVLKAEMAKKNLHTKRGLSNNAEAAKATYINGQGIRRRSAPESMHIDTNYFRGMSGDFSHSYDPAIGFGNDYYNSNYPHLDNGSNYSDIFDPFGPSNPIEMEMSNDYYGDNCLSPTEETDPKMPLFGSATNSRGFSSVLYNSDALLSKSLGSMGINDFPTPEAFSKSVSYSYSPFLHPGADQNPPCNTLYVGNLPNDNCEEELRQMFQCCAGYKRLSYKSRVNGPMCFVEFENVHYATQALFQLSGNYLSNSTKGGIRLSYSKNPLGVRPQTSPNTLTSYNPINETPESAVEHAQ
ncbi:hypothetical protein HK103_000635 [Boothiomyces macroporosus]|uniref:RRM domain-containing protein n=1 Tax=Boothiomyces macroporosus TaxID=261099 RepID=A0AAD5UKC5_9FUNG|nr:hypothetical protein HK103_000635 [Boothiomyces macroporosus]